MTAVLGALREAGIDDRDLRTEGLSLQPVMDYRNDGPPELRGYELRNGVVARLRDLGRLPAAIDGAIAAGATTLDGVRYDVEDRRRSRGRRPRRRGGRCPREGGRPRGRGRGRARAGPLGRRGRRRAADARSRSRGVRSSWPPDAAPTPVEAGESEIVVTVQVVVALV